MMIFPNNFTTMTFFRFGFLAKVVDWLDNWKSLPEKDGKLSAQTFISIKHSCLALPRIVNYLTKECGFNYFLTYFFANRHIRTSFRIIPNDVRCQLPHFLLSSPRE